MAFDGTLVRGTPVFAAGKFGNGVSGAQNSVTGVDDFLSASPGAYAGAMATGTVEGWCKGGTTAKRILFGHLTWFYVSTAVTTGYATLNYGNNTGETVISSTVNLTDGAWHHVAMVMTPSGASLYVDGNRVATSTDVRVLGNTGAQVATIAGIPSSNTFDYTGQLDEIRYSNIARYTGATYTVPTGAFSTDANTVAIYHLESDATNAVGVTDTTAPSVPTGLSVTPGNAQAALAWTASTDNVAVAGYKVYRGGTLIASPTTASYTDTSLTNGTSYSYTVAAVDGAGNQSAQTAAVTATPTAATTVPSAPTGLTATAGNGQVALAWTAPASTGGAAITDYLVEVSSNGGSTWVTFADGTGTGTSGTVTGLTNGTAYQFRVTAVNSVGTGASSGTATANPTSGTGLIAPDDPNIVYSPYTWLVTSAGAKTINAGAYLRLIVTGSASSIVANFDVSNMASTPSQISWRVDQGNWTNQAVASTVTMTLPTNNTWTKRVVEIRVKSTTGGANRWLSPQNTAVIFTGFTVAPTAGVVTGTMRRRKLNVLTYGDSIAEGAYTIKGGGSFDTDRSDASTAWTYPLTDLLGAEVGVVGFGGAGVNDPGVGSAPNLVGSYNQLWEGQTRSFSPAPDLIVINYGTNDHSDITASAKTVLNGLLAAAPGAKIAVVQQWKDTSMQAYWQAAIAGCNAPARVAYVDTTGWFSSADATDGLHPYGYINVTDLAPRLATALRALLGGGKMFLNVGGTATAISPTIQ